MIEQVLQEEPIKLENVISLRTAREQLEVCSHDELVAIAARSFNHRRRSDGSLPKAWQSRLRRAEKENEFEVELLRMAIIANDLAAYVWDRNSREAYKIGAHAVLEFVHPDLFDRDPISDGRFRILSRAYEEGCLELKFVNSAIYLNRDTLADWLGEVCTLTASTDRKPTRSVKGKKGRPRGSGSYDRLDLPILEKMHNAITETPHLSITAVAKRHINEAAGGGTDLSKISRLVSKYRKKYPDM